MVSILGDYYYDFPQPVGCKRVLKDVLEPKVDESYYLKPEVVVSLIKHKERHDAAGHGFGWKPIDIEVNGGGYAKTIKCESGYRPDTNFIIERPSAEDRPADHHSEHSYGAGLQGIWKSANERRNGNYENPQGGG